MQLEEYFEFEKFDTKHGTAERIRVRGTRVAIDIVIDDFNQGEMPDQIQKNYPTLTLEQVYATIAYYLHNKATVDAYMERGRVIEDAYYQEYLQQGPSPVMKRLQALRAQSQTGEQDAS
jgi:uncharacterized protein (DUF433 family)